MPVLFYANIMCQCCYTTYVALQTFILFLAFTIYNYAIVDYINIDTFRIIQCQTYLHSASYYYYDAEHASFNEIVSVVSSHITPSYQKISPR